jgi:hypothetical protein
VSGRGSAGCSIRGSHGPTNAVIEVAVCLFPRSSNTRVYLVYSRGPNSAHCSGRIPWPRRSSCFVRQVSTEDNEILLKSRLGFVILWPISSRFQHDFSSAAHSDRHHRPYLFSPPSRKRKSRRNSSGPMDQLRISCWAGNLGAIGRYPLRGRFCHFVTVKENENKNVSLLVRNRCIFWNITLARGWVLVNKYQDFQQKKPMDCNLACRSGNNLVRVARWRYTHLASLPS